MSECVCEVINGQVKCRQGVKVLKRDVLLVKRCVLFFSLFWLLFLMIDLGDGDDDDDDDNDDDDDDDNLT